MRGLKLFFVLILSCLLVAPVMAKGPKGSSSGRERKGSGEKHFKVHEAKGSKEGKKVHWKKNADTDGDGMLSVEEFKAFKESKKEMKGSKGKKDRSAVNTGWERRADLDEDGFISEDEYKAYRKTLSDDAAVESPMKYYFGEETE